MPGREIIATCLPTIEGLYRHFGPIVAPDTDYPRPHRLCVIGPTRLELESLAPSVCTILDELGADEEGPTALHLPMGDDDSLRQAVESAYPWIEPDHSVPWGLVIALPDNAGADFPATPLTDRLCHLHPAIQMAAILRWRNPSSLVALPDLALASQAGFPQRAALSRTLLERDGPGVLAGADATDAPRNSGKAKAGSPDGLHKIWTDEPYGLHAIPRFVWAHAMEQSDRWASLVSLGSGADEYGGSSDYRRLPRSAHLRRLNRAMVRDIQQDPDRVKPLADIAFGYGQRGDDDRFVPLWELGPSGFWSAASETDFELLGFRALQATRGYEQRRLGDLVKFDPVERWSPGEEQLGSLFFVSEGSNQLQTLRRAPEPPRRRNAGWADEFEARLADWEKRGLRAKLIKLRAGEDADYLWLALADPVLIENIRCRASKSYWEPRVSAAVLAETWIPWPSKEQRDQLVAEFHRLAGLTATLDIDASAIDVKDSWERLADYFDAENNASRVSAREIPERLENFLAWFKDLKEAVDKVSPPHQHVEISRAPSPKYPPAPIAIARRKLDAAAEPAHRLRLAIELAETGIDLDAAVLLAALNQFDPAQVSAVWKSLNLNAVRLALGHKKRLAQDARRALRGLLRNRPAGASGIRAFAESACKIDERAWIAAADEIIRDRNDTIGHGKQLPSVAERALAELIEPKCRKFVDLLGYLENYLLVYLERRTTTRTHTECVLRMLTHDNPLFVRNTLVRPRGTMLDSLCEREVYLHYSEPDGLLPLWPWILFAPAKDGSDAVWFFDQLIKGDRALYKSPLAPGMEHLDNDAGLAAARLIRGETAS